MERWIRWEAIPNLAPKYYIESIMENVERLQINLYDEKNKKNKLILVFPENVEAYRCVNESYRLKLFNDLGQYYEKVGHGEWTFFKVENSKFLKWLSEESYTISDFRALQHFALITDDLIVDIINPSEPTFTLINDN